jgi:NAD(P)H-dependent FMN reductase
LIVGSLRKDSINLKVTNALAELAPAALKLSIIEIGHLPIYNQDADENPPAAWMPPTKPLAETEDFDKIIAVDLKGDFCT